MFRAAWVFLTYTGAELSNSSDSAFRLRSVRYEQHVFSRQCALLGTIARPSQTLDTQHDYRVRHHRTVPSGSVRLYSPSCETDTRGIALLPMRNPGFEQPGKEAWVMKIMKSISSQCIVIVQSDLLSVKTSSSLLPFLGSAWKSRRNVFPSESI